MSGSDDASSRAARRKRWTGWAKIGALSLLVAAPAGIGVWLLAADHLPGVRAGAPAATDRRIDAAAWSALSELGRAVDFSLSVSRPALDGAVAAASAGAIGGSPDRELGAGARLRLVDAGAVPSGPSLLVTVTGRLDAGFFGADLTARAVIEPRFDGDGVVFTVTSVDTATADAVLKRPTFNAAEAAEKAQPAVRDGYAALRETVAALAANLVVPVTLPAEAPTGRSNIAAAFMFDDEGLHALGRFDALPGKSDDDLLTGSLGSAGLTLEHYRSAFRAARAKFVPGEPSDGAAAELTLSRPALGRMLAAAQTRSCAPLAVETEPLVLTGQVRLSDPPAAPQCRQIAAACAARDLCSRAADCRDKIVQETVEETVKVPVRTAGGCGRREFVCYGWGPYGCAWGNYVCTAPRRSTEYRDKVVQRVVSRTETADAPECRNLRSMQRESPGFCDKLAGGKAPSCGLVSNGASTSDCEARAAILDRVREAPTATATVRLVGRGRLQSCTKSALADDLASVKLTSVIAGKLDVVAEVTIRPDARGQTDTALRCSVEPAAALKGVAKVATNRTEQVTLARADESGSAVLAGSAPAGSLSIPLDTAVAASLFGPKSGIVYRCTVEGAGDGPAVAQWESRVGPLLQDIAAKADKLVSSVPAPSFEARLPRTLLLGRETEARISASGASFVVR